MPRIHTYPSLCVTVKNVPTGDRLDGKNQILTRITEHGSFVKHQQQPPLNRQFFHLK